MKPKTKHAPIPQPCPVCHKRRRILIDGMCRHCYREIASDLAAIVAHVLGIDEPGKAVRA